MTVAVFSYPTWAARYPALAASVDQTLAEAYFAEAALYCNNTDVSVIPCDAVTYQPRLALLNMVVAHIATLNRPTDQGGSGLVGRVANATQGSVNVTADMGATPGTAAWFMQTQPGASYWQATAQYRTFRPVFAPAAPPFPRRFPTW